MAHTVLKKDSKKEQWRLKAALYAQMASIESLETLKEWEKLKLIEDAKEAGYELLNLAARFQWQREHPEQATLPTSQEFLKETTKDTEKAWRFLQAIYPVSIGALETGIYRSLATTAAGKLPTYWKALQKAHIRVHHLIVDFLNNGWSSTRIEDLGLKEHLILVKGKNWEVTQYPDKPDVEDEILFDLVQTIKRSPFPFRRCPMCPTIFVPVRKQKYCSPPCTARAFSPAENPARRKSLKEAAQRYRKKKANKKKSVKQT